MGVGGPHLVVVFFDRPADGAGHDPSGLVLTGIVVSVSVSALMLSITIRLYQRYQTLDLDEISFRLKKEGL